MKKLLAILMCLLLSTCTTVFASEIPDLPFGFSEDEERSVPSDAVSEAIQVNVNGLDLTLDFDPSTEFSHVKNGLVQASFYAYGPDGVYLYEVYMTFPETVTSGTVFTPENALQAGQDECCVVMLISTETTDDYYVAAQYGEGVYPEGTSYTIRFESVTTTAKGRVFTGTLNATMVGEDINGAPISEKLVITDAPFSFTMPSGTGASQPYAGATPAPTPTARPDMYRI